MTQKVLNTFKMDKNDHKERLIYAMQDEKLPSNRAKNLPDTAADKLMA